MECDVLIVGGGPAGSSLGSLLRRYVPSLKVVILEREVFPRDHIGESQLPAVCKVLSEMGAWEKVEAAGFPIKIGSTYRWGRNDELWQVNFLTQEIEDRPRPDAYEGQRKRTAFQVDRSIYDKVLLDHAKSVGCHVFENTKVVEILKDGDRVLGVKAVPNKSADGQEGPIEPETITARYYVDASGNSSLFRKAMDIGTDSPTNLRNIAVWDYWQDATWAENVGKYGTRAQIMSIGWGWLWFIPITSTRTSIGLVTPASYLKSSGKRPEELYMEAISIDPRISKLVVGATREGLFQATKDWSYVADRLAGENWFLCGDTCGFADPILSAGMTLAQVGARKVAYTICEMERNEVDKEWLKSEYTRSHRSNIYQHIRFAEYWYSSNGCFSDLNDFCKEIASDAGIDLTPAAAFQWLSNGGFASDTLAEEEGNIVGFRTAKIIANRFAGEQLSWEVGMKNKFKLNLVGATKQMMAYYWGGRVEPVNCYRRGSKILPLLGHTQMVFSAINLESDGTTIARIIQRHIAEKPKLFPDPRGSFQKSIEVFETLVTEGWVTASVDKKRPFIAIEAK